MDQPGNRLSVCKRNSHDSCGRGWDGAGDMHALAGIRRDIYDDFIVVLNLPTQYMGIRRFDWDVIGGCW
jgi:hypothetical protein